jgi:hypothetical protein
VKRIVVAAVSAILALIVAVPIAGAARQEPAQEPPFPVSQDFVLEPGAVFGNCDFPIRFQLSGKGQTLALPGGRFIFTSPDLNVTLTNLESGTQETFNITGALHQSTLENGDVVTVSTGRSILGDPEAGFVIAIGNFSFAFDKKGNLIQPLSGEGQLIDVCEALE